MYLLCAGEPTISVFGVYDGHGACGHLVSAYVRKCLLPSPRSPPPCPIRPPFCRAPSLPVRCFGRMYGSVAIKSPRRHPPCHTAFRRGVCAGGMLLAHAAASTQRCERVMCGGRELPRMLDREMLKTEAVQKEPDVKRVLARRGGGGRGGEAGTGLCTRGRRGAASERGGGRGRGRGRGRRGGT